MLLALVATSSGNQQSCNNIKENGMLIDVAQALTKRIATNLGITIHRQPSSSCLREKQGDE